MKRIMLLVLGTLIFIPTFGREISGTVIDSLTGEALVGATVYVRQQPGSGTATGLDGTFRLSTDVDSPVLVCSYLGYETQTVDNAGRNPLTIKPSRAASARTCRRR